MTKRIKGIFLTFLLSYFLTFLPPPVLAAAPGCITKGDAQSLGCLADVIVSVINTLFLFVGAVTVLFLLYGAIRFIVSRGDPKAIEGAQKTMTYAAVGGGMIILAFVIINIITSAFGLPNILSNFSFYQP